MQSRARAPATVDRSIGPAGGVLARRRERSAYPDRVRTQRQVVDYALQRRALLAEVHSGRVGVAEVCDASPYLLRAARFHGEATDRTCPVCRKERLTQVSWIFGDELKHAAGSARKPEEIEQLANVHGDFSVYVVEVCRTCSWNHLVLSYVMGTGDAPHSRGSDRRRTAAE
ncbi:hypothetical protein GCM10023320_36420 [Pseudonocardia adelaidensis]|uniref:DUF5318 domain-containing protein n=1 Tax=Pseudonocardia adelaidensis TaxID=648754 RepID=A0ABP9NM40_9PSEU